MQHDPLPIDRILPEFLAALQERGAVILRAPTGAGKTTRVPPAILHSGLAGSGSILMLEPRRVAVRAAARRMAIEHGTPLGDVFGYQVRFDRRAGARTRVLVVTPGILLRMLQDNPCLDGVAGVIFDEFHERGIDADLALGMIRLLRDTVRPDLLTVVMSATIDPTPVSRYLGNCPVVDSPGRTFPVEIRYRPRRIDTPVSVAAELAVRDALQTEEGDVLVFLPGLREIRHTAEKLADLASEVIVLPLHGDLPLEQQDRALQLHDRRKVVLATNVAETSVTVEGVAVVVDTGMARQIEFDPSIGMDRLRLVPISRASADQRAGRAGRTRSGVCIRLWDEASHRGRPEQSVPEIRRIDVCGAVLQLFALGEKDVMAFPWLELPQQSAVEQALELLTQLQLVTMGNLTDIGRAAARLPVHPRIARLLIEAERLGIPRRGALAAALLSERDPVVRDFDTGPSTRTGPPTTSDVLDRVELMEAFERDGRRETPFGQLQRAGAMVVLEARNQLVSHLEGARESTASGDPDECLLRCVFAAYPDRLARRREPGSTRAITAGGRGVRLAETSGVIEPELFVCVDVDAAGADSLVRIASGVDRAWLAPERIRTQVVTEYDHDRDRLAARKRTWFGDLLLDESQAHIVDEDEAARVLADAASRSLEKAFSQDESDAARFLTRVRCLRAWMPELGLPALDTPELQELLLELARGRRSLAELRQGPWLALLRGRLNYEQARRVDTEAPERMIVPSGSQIRLEYEEGRPPILAVRIQELFGLTDTPRIASGRVKVLLHLLAPNNRPQQITDDLAGFWRVTYAQVRKDLRGRYPKHAWPEDPRTAEPTRRRRADA